MMPASRSRLALRLLLALAALLLPGLLRAEGGRSFSLSTSTTFAPGETVKIDLYARNESTLEFRVYRIEDEEKFFAGLKDLHGFGQERHAGGPAENIDEKTWIERLHDFKAGLWRSVRDFFRSQFTPEARDTFREKQASMGRRSRVVSAAEFAQIPLLNSSRLVARWRLELPPAIVSETQTLPVSSLDSGAYLIEATDGTFKAYTVAIVTRLVLVERSGRGSAHAFLVDRVSGKPVGQAAVTLWANRVRQATAQTDENGEATLAMAPADGEEGRRTADDVWLLARQGRDSALVTPWGYGLGWSQSEAFRDLTYTDRPVYRPGHTVYIRSILRRLDGEKLVIPTGTVSLEVKNPGDEVVLHRELPISPSGTVAADLKLAADAGLGFYQVTLELNGQRVGSGSYYVEEYKKPEYQVNVTAATGRVLQGNSITATFEARYFFGEPVANAKVKYVVHTARHYWWDSMGGEDSGDEPDDATDSGEDSSGADQTFDMTEAAETEGKLDASGRLTVQIPVPLDPKHHDLDYRIEARVTDAANREVAGHATVLTTYGSFRVSVSPTSYLFRAGEPVEVRVTALDYDNKPVQTTVNVAVNSLQPSASGGRERKQVAALSAGTGPDGSVTLNLPLQNSLAGGGDFEVVASAHTPEGREVEDQSWVWISASSREWYGGQQRMARIVADKKSYKVGETAHLMLLTGVPEAYAEIVTIGSTEQTRRVLHGSDSIAFAVPITAQSQPNLNVEAVFVRENHVYTAARNLAVPPLERTLSVTVTPSRPQYRPGERASFDVFTADASGRPAAADFSFGAVDEALYSVRPDTTPNAVSSFYPHRYDYEEVENSTSFFFSGSAGKRSPLLASLERAQFHPRLAQVKPGSDLIVPKVRKAFPDTAYWNPDIHTAADGHARVEFDFPDSLTTWRETVRAITADGKPGSAVVRVLTRKNLMVRLAAPRFFRQGDEVTLKVITHNYLADTKQVTVSLDARGLELAGGHTQQVSIAPRGESVVEWKVRAQATGDAVLTAKALSNEESDALEETLPVRAYGVRRRQQQSGALLAGSAAPAQVAIAIPPASDASTRSLTVSIAPSVAGTVFDALDYLVGYPWGCTEQTMSSFLPDLVVAEAVDRLNVKAPVDRTTLNKMIAAGLERLYSFQHDDGGWGWWQDDPSRVFMTAYVVSGLGTAGQSRKVDADRLARGRKYLGQTLASHPNMVAELRAYVVYALATTGGAPAEAVDKMWRTRSKLSDEGLALAGLVLGAGRDAESASRAGELEKMLADHARSDGAGVHWESKYDELLDDFDDTSLEATAMALKFLVAREPANPLNARAAQWLAAQRRGGYWYSTKQTAMVLYGMTSYLLSSQELASSPEVEVLWNGQPVAHRRFTPNEAFAAPLRLAIDPSRLTGSGQLTIRKTGSGAAYWSTEASWYSADKAAFEQGRLNLNVTRDYYVLRKRQDKPAAPITYDLAPLSGPVHVGDVIAVRLAVSGSDWKYLLAEDPIPSGTEFVDNPGLYTVNHRPDWWGSWFTREEFHDDRAAFFQTETRFPTRSGSRLEYFYLLKAVNPGRFPVSPAQAGPMYQPDVQSTTDPATLEIQP